MIKNKAPLKEVGNFLIKKYEGRFDRISYRVPLSHFCIKNSQQNKIRNFYKIEKLKNKIFFCKKESS